MDRRVAGVGVEGGGGTRGGERGAKQAECNAMLPVHPNLVCHDATSCHLATTAIQSPPSTWTQRGGIAHRPHKFSGQTGCARTGTIRYAKRQRNQGQLAIPSLRVLTPTLHHRSTACDGSTLRPPSPTPDTQAHSPPQPHSTLSPVPVPGPEATGAA